MSQKIIKICFQSRAYSSVTPSLIDSQIKIWDEIERKIVPFRTRIPNVATWYSCGPTVYDSAHIGHAR